MRRSSVAPEGSGVWSLTGDTAAGQLIFIIVE
jgi:hypothetical protein